ncbi:hypothetical protein C3L33_01248, partial [Rhododendron williamsianum]
MAIPLVESRDRHEAAVMGPIPLNSLMSPHSTAYPPILISPTSTAPDQIPSASYFLSPPSSSGSNGAGKSSNPPTLLSLLLIPLLRAPPARANADESSIQLVTDALEYWPPASTMSLYDADQFDAGGDEVDPDGVAIGRRSLFWRSIMRYYISYGALSANRIPCPARSGRSYYTHNCTMPEALFILTPEVAPESLVAADKEFCT